MIVKKKSVISGNVNAMDLPITEEQIVRWQDGEMIQDVFPFLTAMQREFLISGSTEEEWDAILADEQ